MKSFIPELKNNCLKAKKNWTGKRKKKNCLHFTGTYLDKHLHIITHDIPWPADYGGVVDLFYKIKTLHSMGVKIHLHCFHNDKTHKTNCLNTAAVLITMPGRKNIKGFSWNTPYIVQSRSDEQLLKNLQADDHPILIEGIHCSYLLYHNKLPGRKIHCTAAQCWVEVLSTTCPTWIQPLKSFISFLKARLLKKYEQAIAGKAPFLCK